MAEARCLLLGCGILAKEVRWLIDKNDWALDTDFLPSSLHVNLEALACALGDGLARHTGEDKIVFYGACHPRMDDMLAAAGTFRTAGQNCVDMLLGHEAFMAYLAEGAFFLLEDWALHWDEAMVTTFGHHPEVIREIFHLSNKYVLALRTPCSGDFTQAATAAAASVDLPLRWLDVGLDGLAQTLRQAIADHRRQAVSPSGI